MTWLHSYLPAFPSLTSLVKPPVLDMDPDSPPTSPGRADKRRFAFSFPIRNELELLYSASRAMRRRNTAPSALAPAQPLPPSSRDKGQDRAWQDRMWQWKTVDKAVPVNHQQRSLLVAWHLALYAGLQRASLSEHMHAHGASSLWPQGEYGNLDTQGAGADVRASTLARLEALAKQAGRPVEKKRYAHARHEDVIADISRHTENGGPCLVLWHSEVTPRLIYGIRQHEGNRHIETLDLDRGLSRLALDTPAFWHDKSSGRDAVATAAATATAATGDYQLSVQVYFFPANENALLRTASAPITRTRAGCKDRKQRPQSQPA